MMAFTITYNHWSDINVSEANEISESFIQTDDAQCDASDAEDVASKHLNFVCVVFEQSGSRTQSCPWVG